EHVGARVLRTDDHDEIRSADGVIVPGVGAFPEAMRRLRAGDLAGVIAERDAAGVPVLGICLGMQLLFERSTELGGAEGLGLLPGEVRALDARGLKVPQIGWNAVRWRRRSPLAERLPDPCAFYHVHSFAAVPADPADVVGAAVYGEEFPSVVARGSLFGVQFHPEKSGDDGLRLLANFVRICASGAARAELRSVA
ncbi:MAG: imidazole glycerol phosphate synthase subunit HisH, partial [Actinomycetota bacterium]|nr:imidazole glycerol phosphate synthase subunit HisH [Actinomycetota bacterium]